MVLCVRVLNRLVMKQKGNGGESGFLRQVLVLTFLARDLGWSRLVLIRSLRIWIEGNLVHDWY